MDDLVVIILTLIVAVVGTLGQIKKNKASKATPAPVSEQEDIWDSLNVEVGVESENSREVEKESAPMFVPSKSSYQFEATMEGDSILNNGIDKIPNLKTVNKRKTKTKISLRKAVIYSEILNRKYL